MDFIRDYLDHSQNYESPGAFWKWSAYATIAAVLRDNVWVFNGDSRLYPNIYVLFLAGSGARKGRPVELSEELLTKVNNTKIISGRASIQAILDELARTETKLDGSMMKGGAAIFYAPELSAGIVGDPAAVSILTDIYDGKTNFQSILRHSPRFKVDRIVFSCFWASNEEMLGELFDARGKQGGLLARTFLVTPDEFRPRNALMRETVQEKIERESRMVKLALTLTEISKLKGAFDYTDGAVDEMTDWYVAFGNRHLKKHDKGGIAGRLHTGVKKLSMILAANEGSNIITKDHMAHAIDTCVGLMGNYNTFLMANKSNTVSEACALLIKVMLKREGYEISRKEFLREHFAEIDAETLTKAVATLEEGEVIQSSVDRGTMTYSLTKKILDKLIEGGNGNEQKK